MWLDGSVYSTKGNDLLHEVKLLDSRALYLTLPELPRYAVRSEMYLGSQSTDQKPTSRAHLTYALGGPH